MFKMSEAAAVLRVLAAGILVCVPAAGADKSCALVALEPGSKAGDVKAKLMLTDESSFTVEPVGDSMLAVCSENAAMLPVAREAIGRLSSQRPESNQTRLFFHRDGKGLAAALDQKVAGIHVNSPDSSDLLIFDASPGDEGSLRELKRLVTLMDAPRPEVTVNAWSVQISASKQETVTATAKAVRDVVSRYNQELQEALGNAWNYLNDRRLAKDSTKDSPQEMAQYFAGYVLERYRYPGSEAAGCQDAAFGKYWYCLGYERAFSATMQPSLANMIGILASFKDPKIPEFVAKLEGGQHHRDPSTIQEAVVSSPRSKPSPACDEQDEQYYRTATKYGPHFACFQEQLNSSLTSTYPLARLRTAMADFLFQYKFRSTILTTSTLTITRPVRSISTWSWIRCSWRSIVT